MAVVGVSWHADGPACWYSGGFSLTHKRLSPGWACAAVRAGGLHQAGHFLQGIWGSFFMQGEGGGSGFFLDGYGSNMPTP